MVLAAGGSPGASARTAGASGAAPVGTPIDEPGKARGKLSDKEKESLDAFVKNHYAEAKEAAGVSEIKPEFILALSAHESYFGMSRAAREQGNFFGTSVAKKGDGRQLLTLGGFKEGAERFVTKWRGRLNPTGVNPPATIEEFMDRLTDKEPKYNALG